MPTAAVLIAAYCDQSALNASIASLDKEAELTVIVVDDGSPTPLTVDSSATPHKCALLRNPHNVGLTKSLNVGLAYVRDNGFDYVLRLDAGDLFQPGRASKQIEFLESNREYAAVGGQALFIGLKGDQRSGEIFPTDYKVILRRLHAKHCFIHPTLAFRMEALLDSGFYNESFSTAQDYELMFRLARKYPVTNLPDTLITYVDNAAGISVKRRQSQVYNRLRVMLKNFNPFEPLSYLGLLKSLPLLILPRHLIESIKVYLPEKRGWL